MPPPQPSPARRRAREGAGMAKTLFSDSLPCASSRGGGLGWGRTQSMALAHAQPFSAKDALYNFFEKIFRTAPGAGGDDGKEQLVGLCTFSTGAAHHLTAGVEQRDAEAGE